MKKRNLGFTLIELLVVIGIIAMLSGIILVRTSISRMKARDVTRVTDFKTLQQALELYYADKNTYPNNGIVYIYTSPSFPGNPWKNFLGLELEPYLSTIPYPRNNSNLWLYYYYQTPGNSCYVCDPYSDINKVLILRCPSYRLFTTFEDSNNTLGEKDGGILRRYYEVMGGDYEIRDRCPPQ